MDLKEKYGFTFPVSSMITARPNFHYVREPVFRRMPDGSLFSVGLSGGLMEPANENVVVAVQSYDDGQTWTLPRVLFRHSERAVWATELFTEGPRPLLFVHTYHAASQYREIHTYVSTTRDSGKILDPAAKPALRYCQCRGAAGHRAAKRSLGFSQYTGRSAAASGTGDRKPKSAFGQSCVG